MDFKLDPMLNVSLMNANYRRTLSSQNYTFGEDEIVLEPLEITQGLVLNGQIGTNVLREDARYVKESRVYYDGYYGITFGRYQESATTLTPYEVEQRNTVSFHGLGFTQLVALSPGYLGPYGGIGLSLGVFQTDFERNINSAYLEFEDGADSATQTWTQLSFGSSAELLFGARFDETIYVEAGYKIIGSFESDDGGDFIHGFVLRGGLRFGRDLNADD